MIVIIESPFKGTCEEHEEYNRDYARACLRDSLNRGEAPFASHLLYTQVLNDSNPKERQQGIKAGLQFYAAARTCAVYVDLGVSPGMILGSEKAIRHRVQVELRKLGTFWKPWTGALR
jgi:hypothetical protein